MRAPVHVRTPLAMLAPHDDLLSEQRERARHAGVQILHKRDRPPHLTPLKRFDTTHWCGDGVCGHARLTARNRRASQAGAQMRCSTRPCASQRFGAKTGSRRSSQAGAQMRCSTRACASQRFGANGGRRLASRDSAHR